MGEWGTCPLPQKTEVYPYLIQPVVFWVLMPCSYVGGCQPHLVYSNFLNALFVILPPRPRLALRPTQPPIQ
jgi:hypothetical protein